jgi:hypothetical protein
MTVILPKEKKELWGFVQFCINYLFKGKDYDISITFDFKEKIEFEGYDEGVWGVFIPHVIGEHNKGNFDIEIKDSKYCKSTIAHELTHLWQNVTGKYLPLTKGGFLFKGRKYAEWHEKHPVEIEAEKFEREITEAWNKL